MPETIEEVVWWAVTVGVPLLLLALKGLLYLGYKHLMGVLRDIKDELRGHRDDLNVEREEREQLSYKTAAIEARLQAHIENCRERHR